MRFSMNEIPHESTKTFLFKYELKLQEIKKQTQQARRNDFTKQSCVSNLGGNERNEDFRNMLISLIRQAWTQGKRVFTPS